MRMGEDTHADRQEINKRVIIAMAKMGSNHQEMIQMYAMHAQQMKREMVSQQEHFKSTLRERILQFKAMICHRIIHL